MRKRDKSRRRRRRRRWRRRWSKRLMLKEKKSMPAHLPRLTLIFLSSSIILFIIFLFLLTFLNFLKSLFPRYETIYFIFSCPSSSQPLLISPHLLLKPPSLPIPSQSQSNSPPSANPKTIHILIPYHIISRN